MKKYNKQLQGKYMNTHLKHSVLYIKEVYLECKTTDEPEMAWAVEWMNALKQHVEPEIWEGIEGLWYTYKEYGLPLKEFLFSDWYEGLTFPELSKAYFQAYMWYKVRGIDYEEEVITKLRENFGAWGVYEDSALDYKYKIDAIVNGDIAVQIKNYNPKTTLNWKYLNAARMFPGIKRYIIIGNDYECYEIEDDVLTKKLTYKKVDFKTLEVIE